MENSAQILDEYLTGQGVIESQMTWRIQTGGRTNHVWHLQGHGMELVCKLYDTAQNNPLFSNQPEVEFATLKYLTGMGVAPKPFACVETPLGQVLLYHYIAGDIWQNGGACVAQLLNRIHAITPPPHLRQLAWDGETIAKQTHDILERLDKATARELLAYQPAVISVPNIAPRFIHTDVVAGNLIESETGLCLIDWQCPAIGDPVVDMAMFLSPAMHHIYGASHLSTVERAAFLDGFSAQQVARYQAVAPLYHWRLAAYCMWRAQNGDAGYEGAASAELAALQLM